LADTPEGPDNLVPLDAIGQAPIRPPDALDYNLEASAFYSDLVARLQVENADLRARVEKAEGQLTTEQVRARMMEPWADKVFVFVSIYCGALLVLVLLAGFKVCDFNLSDTVLAVLAGSTAVSVIGLIGIVASGLFGGKSPSGS